jgi:hypothetical protein
MSGRSVPQRISDFLVQHEFKMYCDTCVQERLGLKWRQQVQLVTATLAVTDTFERALDRCSACQEVKQVIKVARNSAANKGPASAHLKLTIKKPVRNPIRHSNPEIGSQPVTAKAERKLDE